MEVIKIILILCLLQIIGYSQLTMGSYTVKVKNDKNQIINELITDRLDSIFESEKKKEFVV